MPKIGYYVVMTQQDIPKAYEPKKVEDSIYQRWEESGFFNPDKLPGQRQRAFTISMPPPNATGILHIGHAVMLAVQDLVIRFQRMNGKKALWLPGSDHAGIATQTKVEKLLKDKEGKSRHDLGRAEFLKRVDEFVAASRNTIKNQVKKMGSSCDWSRERFTLDEGLNQAVNHAFKQMFDDGLIYRGDRIVNWCPRCSSTLADDEVEYQNQQGKFYYIKYGPFVVATTRPETKIGDTAVAVNPNDQRYQQYLGQDLAINLGKINIKVKVIADESVDPEFGTGTVGVTPAHSLVDFAMAQKNNLPIIQVIGPDGKMTDQAGVYAGLTVEDCRSRFVKDLTDAGLIDKIEEIDNNLSICYRCGHVIEPLISKQWFIDVNKPVKKFNGQSIKQRALGVVTDGDIKIIPERFNKIYYHWLENLRDWCISRQIWYGHRIPVWYRGEEIYVGQAAPTGEGWQQDPDTLDTWFSSGLWTFSTLGWPQSSKDLKTFHPTSLMETAYDILFFWVARMIIMSTYLVEQIPFREVYLHGLIRDEQGRKMSKSLENIIDPLDTIAKYGADATRLSLVIGTAPGNDSNISEAKIEGYRNFVNKLWNISRYILMKVKSPKVVDRAPKAKTLADQWILAELHQLTDFVTKNLEQYNFSLAGEKIYEFTWSNLADWYVEITKSEDDKDEILLYILTQLLKLWHPFTPFVTEEIWQKLNAKELLMVQSWPQAKVKIAEKDVLSDFQLVKDIVTAIRNLRTESKLPPAQRLRAVIISPTKHQLISQQSVLIKNLARLEELVVLSKGTKPSESLSAILTQAEIYLPVSGMLDIVKETKRLEQEADRIAEFVTHLEQKLSNEHFVERAPKDIIANEKIKLVQNQERLAKIRQQLEGLQ
ncbi:MAG: valine--tRNA ligase [Patescibacteria group bacterium]|jgi:valyl-tRNA synthetase|nr:valine--tRNA ligase [Patescibacteria group bacterium]